MAPFDPDAMDFTSLVALVSEGVRRAGLSEEAAREVTQHFMPSPDSVDTEADRDLPEPQSDRVDAAMLARMGAALELQAQTPRPKSFHDLRELLAARRALIKDRAAAKIRRSVATLPLLKRQLEDRLALIDKDVKRIDTELARMAALDPDLSRRVAILQTIPGVGEVTAVTLTIDMPELGELEGKQAASLAGLAPVSQQSGRWQGKERIQGGRAALRQALYFPAIVAARFNVDLKLIYDRLTAAGKQKKVALVAIMRRLIVMANALIRDNRPWAPNHT